MKSLLTQRDFPEAFSVMATYLKDNWPLGHLTYTESEDALAKMLSYSSKADALQQAETAVLPDEIEMVQIYRQMLVLALYHFGVNPNLLLPVLHESPIKELSLYSVSYEKRDDDNIEEMRSRLPYPIFIDEYYPITSSPSEQEIDAIAVANNISPYVYAVTKSGNIYDRVAFLQLLNILGPTEDYSAILNDSMTSDDFTKRYIESLAFIPLKEHLSHNHSEKISNWVLPEQVLVYLVIPEGVKVDDDDAKPHYLLFNCGVDAYYPATFKCIDTLNEAIARLFRGEIIENDGSLIGDKAIGISLSPNFYKNAGYVTNTFQSSGQIEINGQTYIRNDPLVGYEQLRTNFLLKGLNLKEPTSTPVNNGFIPEAIYCDHELIRFNMSHLLDNFRRTIKNSKAEDIAKIFNTVFAGKPTSSSDVLFSEYGSEMLTQLSDEDELRYTAIGESCLTLYPELAPYFQVSALGSIYADFQNYYLNLRYTQECIERNIDFVAHALLKSTLTINEDFSTETSVFIGLLVMTSFLDDASALTEDIFFNQFSEIAAMLKNYERQKPLINQLKSYNNFLLSQDAAYLSHGKIYSDYIESFFEGF